MQRFLKCLCFCFDISPPPTPKEKTRRSAKQHRLNTKYKKQQFVTISEEHRKGDKLKVYCCPICTNYYNKILACGDCNNCICLHCFENYDLKNVQKRVRMKCPFCNSTKSIFSDYELQPHSYFDTTNKGFLSKEQRIKIDNELGVVPSEQLLTVPETTEQAIQIN